MTCISSKSNDYGVPHFHKSSRCSQLQQDRYHSTRLEPVMMILHHLELQMRIYPFHGSITQSFPLEILHVLRNNVEVAYKATRS